MDRRDQELLDKQMRRLGTPRNDGVIAVMLAAMFLLGMTLGSVLSTPKVSRYKSHRLIRGLSPYAAIVLRKLHQMAKSRAAHPRAALLRTVAKGLK